MAGKSQADVALVSPVVGVHTTDYYALDVADVILGQFGMMGRIGDSVRQKQGLAYYAFCSISPGKTQSLWFSRAGVDPSNVDKAIESVQAVLRDAIDAGFTQDELDGSIQLMTGRLALTMQTNAGIAALLQTIEEYGLGLDYVTEYPKKLADVTLSSANDALRRSLDPDRLLIGVAGPGAS